jgi:hypothetical protein
MKLEQSAVRSGNDRALDAVLHSDGTGNHSSRSAVQMTKSAGKALVGAAVLAALAGCASQDTFGLPDLTPRGAQPAVQVYPNYGAGYGYGYGYPNGYRQGYGYGYADPYYAAPGPYPYAYGYGYNPYPRYVAVPCGDSNRDGRCDSRPPKGRDQHGDGHSGDPGRDDRPRAVPAPAPVVQQPARVRPESRRALPPDATAPRPPRVGRSRPSTTGDDVTLSPPTQEP